MSALDFLPRERDGAVEIALVARDEQRIAQHVAERRRERERELKRHAVLRQAVEHSQQRQIRLRDRLVEPILLQELLIFRMPHIGQMRVENESEVSVGSHGCGVRGERSSRWAPDKSGKRKPKDWVRKDSRRGRKERKGPEQN